MKKVLSLILALMLCLSLCACGGEAENEIPEETEQETESPKEENIAEIASVADFRMIYNECKENIVAAKDDYVGKPYRFAGIVKKITEDSITVAPKSFPTYPYGSWYYVEIAMPEEEIKKVSDQQIVNVAGVMSELNNKSAKMEKGVVIDDAILFSGVVNNFYIDGSYHVMQIKKTDAYGTTLYNFKVSEVEKFENIEEATIGGITFVEGDTIEGTAKMKANGAYTDSFNIVEFVSVEK